MSANRAWFSHRVIDGEYWVLNYPPNIPFMWQYDLDANAQLGSTAFFPDYYKLQPLLTDRPVMHGVAWFFGRGVSLIINPVLNAKQLQPIVEKGIALVKESDLKHFYSDGKIDSSMAIDFLSRYMSAVAGLILFKVIIYCIAGIMMFQLVRYFFHGGIALFSVVYLFINGYMLNAIGTYHTYEFQVLTPIIIVYLFNHLCIQYSLQKNIFFSLIVGILVMTKPNYAAYAAVILYSLFFLKNRRLVLVAVPLSIVIHSLPWLAWHFYLEVTGSGLFGILSDTNLVGKAPPLHPYSIIVNEFLMSDSDRLTSGLEAGLPASGVPTLLQSEAYNFTAIGIVDFLQTISTAIGSALRSYGTFVGFFSAIGIYMLWKNQYRRTIVWLIALLFLTSLIQALVAFPGFWHDRFMYDLYFAVYAIGSFSIFQILSSIQSSRTRAFILSTILLVSFTSTVLNKVTLPWVHPFDQKGLYSLRIPNKPMHCADAISSPALSCPWHLSSS